MVERGIFSEDAVIQAYSDYVQRYKSPADAKVDVDELRKRYANRKLEHKGLGVWAFATGMMVDFAYNEISVKRRGALREFTRIMRLGLSNIDGLKSEINYYFCSKYYRELEKYLLDYDIEVLWKYLERSDGSLDELRQLHGGVVRHLSANPSHVVFRLIRAYCLLSHINFDPNEAPEFLSAFNDARGDPTLGFPTRRTIGEWLVRFEKAITSRVGEPSAVFSTWIASYQLEWVDGFLLKHSKK